MNAIIIEDEQIAVQSLKRLLGEVSSDINVTATFQSVEETVEYFSAFETELSKSDESYPDIVFLDIHLADGLAFHIFDSVTIQCPIIFTTAYDQYALDAFKVNSIDYLLKPISKDELERAINKVRQFVNPGDEKSRQKETLAPDVIATMMEMMQHRKYKSHFLMPLRDKLVPLPVSEIAYIYLDEKITRVVTIDGQSFSLDKPLDALYSQLDPDRFFRANRQYIISHRAVKDISVWPLSKLHITLCVPTPEKIIVSRARNSEFKDWFTSSGFKYES